MSLGSVTPEQKRKIAKIADTLVAATSKREAALYAIFGVLTEQQMEKAFSPRSQVGAPQVAETIEMLREKAGDAAPQQPSDAARKHLPPAIDSGPVAEGLMLLVKAQGELALSAGQARTAADALAACEESGVEAARAMAEIAAVLTPEQLKAVTAAENPAPSLMVAHWFQLFIDTRH